MIKIWKKRVYKSNKSRYLPWKNIRAVSAIFQCFKHKIISCGSVKLNIRCRLMGRMNSSLSHAQKQQYSFRNYFIPLWITIAASPLLSVAGSGTRATERRRSRSRSRANVIESKLAKRHSIYIRTVSFYSLLSTLLIQFKLVYRPFGQSNMQMQLDFCPDQPGRIQMCQ